jgi:S-ribosylhomocysteine lyase LuxS involved in autoinducer biosynthesis
MKLDMIEDMLGGIQRARNFKRLSTAVRIQDCGNDKQKRLAEARSLVDKLLYEKAKLQINHVKLEKLQVGTSSSSFQSL